MSIVDNKIYLMYGYTFEKNGIHGQIGFYGQDPLRMKLILCVPQ